MQIIIKINNNNNNNTSAPQVELHATTHTCSHVYTLVCIYLSVYIP